MTKKRDSGLHEYVANSANSSFINETKVMQTKLHNHIDIYIKNFLPKGFDLQSVLHKVEHTLPASLMQDVDAIIIGDFKMLKKKDLDAVYEDGAIYLTNDQKSEADMYDDIVHEVAHAVEKNYGMEIYGDGQLETEFINKRRVLYSTLNAHGISNLTMYDYINPDYDKAFDPKMKKLWEKESTTAKSDYMRSTDRNAPGFDPDGWRLELSEDNPDRKITVLDEVRQIPGTQFPESGMVRDQFLPKQMQSTSQDQKESLKVKKRRRSNYGDDKYAGLTIAGKAPTQIQRNLLDAGHTVEGLELLINKHRDWQAARR